MCDKIWYIYTEEKCSENPPGTIKRVYSGKDHTNDGISAFGGAIFVKNCTDVIDNSGDFKETKRQIGGEDTIMRMCSIASGSSGNCIYVGSDDTHLLVDTGISKKRIEEGLKTLELKGEDLDGILITHEHSDHIQGLGVFSRKYEIPIYATPGTIMGIKSYSGLGKMPEGLYREIRADEPFELGDMTVKPFAISHDANEPSGYRLEQGGKSVAGCNGSWKIRQLYSRMSEKS